MMAVQVTNLNNIRFGPAIKFDKYGGRHVLRGRLQKIRIMLFTN